jgi:tRNA A37 threonylcarbamoyladenosine dehydratase
MMREREDLDHSYIGGHFDRQVRIDDWNQKILEQQTVFIMGVGGLGSIVLIAMLRLGVKKIIIVDYDVVDNHNMNRQLMYSIKDIGKPKV